MSDTLPSTAPSDQDALLDALQSVLMPLARLAVAKGLTFAATEESLKQAFVRAAQEAQLAQGLPAHRLVSRISTATGINRREVTRLTQADTGAPRPEAASLVSQLFTRWLSDRSLRLKGKPRSLPRHGEAPSFEALARSVTQDVHPRSLLDELCRLKLARWDEASDTVSLVEDGFTPHGDTQRMLAFLGSNTGDHLQAAVSNVLSDEPVHFEQAVFAEGLSAESVEQLRVLARRHWKTLLAEAVPLLESRIEADATQPETARRRVRMGLFTFHADDAPPSSPDHDEAVPVRKPRKRT
ncbi:DUF6502 family protein [Aquabacterium sp.]|uniref:DUF6502 family protein n=1 Tax=Aquabacterium sp. TaxID=1872578 RepID=UPI0025C0BD84|nr:DUF6502 family protein [Aquabacterium sp.]